MTYDVIIIGAGSVGIPAAYSLAGAGVKTLVLEALPSPGQGNAKKAIGGIRATHSDYGKIKICSRSIEILKNWKEEHGDEIDWLDSGYSYVAYRDQEENSLKSLMKIQHQYGLDVRWVNADEYAELVPGINREGLRGASWSPGDGTCSTLLTNNAMYFAALSKGAQFRFNETVSTITRVGDSFTVTTNHGQYSAGQLINAAGNNAKHIATLLGLDIPVKPDCHEAAISEPVQPFFKTMVVDIRAIPGSKNYYFYQNKEGQVVFCITPDPSIWGDDNDSTSVYFPQVAVRMVELLPRLANLKIRRAWRGQYPMTPDGFPIVGREKDIPNYINAVGMCGQGFMLGPGLGELLARMVTRNPAADDDRILASFDPYRDFSGTEVLK